MATEHMPSRASSFQEVTAGVPPANAGAWASSGISYRHLASNLDLSVLEAAMLEDDRSQLNNADDEPMVIGIAGGGNIEVPNSFYMHGTGQSPADGSAVTEDNLSTLIEHCWGGMSMGTTDALVGSGAHTTTAVELTDTVAAGNWLGFDDADGITHLRRVESVAAGGVGMVHTLHRALPFTPADASLARGCAVYYLDEDVLEDSAAGPYTFSWLWERGRGAQRETWQAHACKTSILGFDLSRNNLAVMRTSTRVGSFLTPNLSPVPSWSNSQYGSAGSVVGIRTSVWLVNRGTTTNTRVQVSGFNLDPGIRSIPIETQTAGDNDDNMPGLYGYTMDRQPCTLSMNLVPHADGPLTDFAARTEKSLQWERLGAAGSSWSIYLPRATYSATPKLTDVSSIAGQALSLRGHYDDDATTTITRSKIQLIRC